MHNFYISQLMHIVNNSIEVSHYVQISFIIFVCHYQSFFLSLILYKSISYDRKILIFISPQFKMLSSTPITGIKNRPWFYNHGRLLLFVGWNQQILFPINPSGQPVLLQISGGNYLKIHNIFDLIPVRTSGQIAYKLPASVNQTVPPQRPRHF